MTMEWVIAEDNPKDRAFLAGLLSDRPLRLAGNGEEAFHIASAMTEPMVITDLQMPRLNGIEFARRLWRQAPQARIVFWSQHKDEMYVRALAKIIPAETVYGYVLKDNEPEVLRKAIETVFIEGQCWIDPQLRPIQARTQSRNEAINDFEYEVLVDIALGLTDLMIAQRRYLSRRGVQNRLQSLYVKLGIDQEKIAGDMGEAINMRARAVAMALRRGLINAYELQEEERKFKQWLERQESRASDNRL
ncbi:MAG: response regulator transcription factor [Betaproteobacteria bacterium]|nr:response regulator transcription factor [Betaproteobacteria bacterium]